MERSWRLNYLSALLLLLGVLYFIFVDGEGINRRNYFSHYIPDSWLKLQYVKEFPTEALNAVLTSGQEDQIEILHSEQRKSADHKIYRASVEFIPSTPVTLSTKFKESNWKDFNWRNFYERNNCRDIVPYELKRLKLYFFYWEGKRTETGKNASEDAELVVDPETNRHCLYYQYEIH